MVACLSLCTSAFHIQRMQPAFTLAFFAAAGGGDQTPGAEAAAAPSASGPPLALPLPWESYFDQLTEVDCPARGARFTVYEAGIAGPVVLCLHGGGYSGLTWALFAQRLRDRWGSARQP